MSKHEAIVIIHDDYHARHIGETGEMQFFLTTPFVPAGANTDGCEFIALYLFDAFGEFIEAKIENLGPRKDLDRDIAKARYDEILNSIDDPTFCDINIEPFSVVKFGVEFGLIPVKSEYLEEGEEAPLEVQPGNYMAFFPPWDGYYDT